jgi:hypothetical protein
MDLAALWASKDFWGPLAAGGFLILLGVVHLLRYRRFRRRAKRTPGVVVDLQVGLTTQAGHPLYYPVVEFTTGAGRRVRATTRVGSKPAPADVGEAVIVSYDPGDPEEVEIAGTEATRLALLYVVVLLGMVFVGVAWL